MFYIIYFIYPAYDLGTLFINVNLCKYILFSDEIDQDHSGTVDLSEFMEMMTG
jgi:hypothetical protein